MVLYLSTIGLAHTQIILIMGNIQSVFGDSKGFIT